MRLKRFLSLTQETEKRGEAKQRDKTCMSINEHGQVLVDEVGTGCLPLLATCG